MARMATSLEIARDLRAQAATLVEAANILDPPKKKTRSTNGRRKRKYLPTEPTDDVRHHTRMKPHKIALGTAGRTSHPSDTDAKALSEHLAYTTEEPK